MPLSRIAIGWLLTWSVLSQDKPFDPSTLKPFTDSAVYLDKYETGLYPGGKNLIPPTHRKAGEQLAASIGPLDLQEKPAKDGRLLALVLGHSNCNMYFTALGAGLTERAQQVHPRFELLNAAVGGQH